MRSHKRRGESSLSIQINSTHLGKSPVMMLSFIVIFTCCAVEAIVIIFNVFENILCARHNTKHWRCKNKGNKSSLLGSSQILVWGCFSSLQTILYTAARMIFLKQLTENIILLHILSSFSHIQDKIWNPYQGTTTHSTPFTLEPWTTDHSLNISQALPLLSLCSCCFILFSDHMLKPYLFYKVQFKCFLLPLILLELVVTFSALLEFLSTSHFGKFSCFAL